MRAAVTLALAFGYAASAWAQPTQASPSPLTQEQREQIAKMPAMGEEKRVKADDIDALLAEGKVLFLDVREPKELEELGTREGYVNIPIGQLEARLGELPKDKAILTA